MPSFALNAYLPRFLAAILPFLGFRVLVRGTFDTGMRPASNRRSKSAVLRAMS